MSDPHKIVLLFPGQGSQEVGMGWAIAERFTCARELFEEANGILGFNFRKLCVEGPEDELMLTKNSQPAIFITSIACIRALKEVAPDMPLPLAAAGLSLGEFSAHVAAGSFSFADGLKLVRQRGEAMQDACDLEPSTMASIVGLDADTVQQICALFQDRDVIDLANLNCPDQIAISGRVGAVKAAMAEAEKRGAKKAVQLQVSGAFQSRLMKPAEEKLRRAVAETKIIEPRYPVIANVSALPVTRPEEIREALLTQLCSPVLWEKSMRYLMSRGTTLFMEVGHGRVLRGLMRRIDKDQKVVSVQDPDSLGKALEALNMNYS
jgi:[acyl-carrier-protein] S-malonyltransferase